MQGKLEIGPLVRIQGAFFFEFDAQPFAVRIGGSAKLELLNFITFDVDLAMVVDGQGFAALMDIHVGVQGLGLKFNMDGKLRLNTSSTTRSLKVPYGASTRLVEAAPGFELALSGSVTFLGFASADGSVRISIASGKFTLEFDVKVHLGPIDVEARGGAGIYADGIVLVLDASLRANIIDVIKINASGKLQLNTTRQSWTLVGITVASGKFLISLTGEVKFLEVLKFNASFTMVVGESAPGIAQEGAWYVSFSAGHGLFRAGPDVRVREFQFEGPLRYQPHRRADSRFEFLRAGGEFPVPGGVRERVKSGAASSTSSS